MTTIVALADTHGHHRDVDIPDGDILIHAGDFCKWGSRDELPDLVDWFKELPHRWKIVIAGNHDFCAEKHLEHVVEAFALAGVFYLQDGGMEAMGLKIWGSPWTPVFGNWAFMLPEEALRTKFSQIPEDLDILITHGPPWGFLDRSLIDGKSAGSEALLNRMVELSAESVEPPVHVFGHIHEAYGFIHHGRYGLYNASICDVQYRPVNKPWVIEIP